jgi:alkylhydroperoxidase family enzyme
MILLPSMLVLLAIAAANYSGMCVAQLRYLSDDEKVDSAIAFVLERGWLPHDGRPGDPHYESAEQYRKLVPDCCTVSLGFVDGGEFLDRILGRLSAYVVIANVPRATAEAAAPHELRTILGSLRDNQHYFIAVSNCGRGWDFTD